jgi:caa(3)-type oxidase subunit IV
VTASHPATPYVKVWALLVLLLIISLLGPLLEIPAVTLVTAFGIALVKAFLVAVYFMHLHIEKRYIRYMFYSMLLMVGLLFAGTATDIMQPAGQRWEHPAVLEHTKAYETQHGNAQH